MKTRNSTTCTVLIVITGLVLGLTGIVCAQEPWWKQRDVRDPLDQRSVHDAWNSRVKWDDGYMEVMAGATADPSMAKNLAHARALALKTARHLAYEKMLETIKGVNLDSDNVFRNELVRDATLRTTVKGMIEGARVVKEEEKYLDDGSIWMEVTLGMFLNHRKGLSGATYPWYKKHYAFSPSAFHPKDDGYKKVYMYGERYTGLIIDASNLNGKPAMFPKILAFSDKKEVYGPGHVDRDYAIMQGVVGYANSVEKARLQERVGNNPLTLRAVGMDGANKANPVLSDEDAVRLFAADQRTRFLNECRVIIVIN